jgi:hypothetical protein
VGRNEEKNSHGKKLKNGSHASTTDQESRLFKKSAGKEAKLSYMAHALMENWDGLIVEGMLINATGTAEREAAAEMIASIYGTNRITVVSDKNYHTKEFVKTLRQLNVTPHVAQNITNRSSSIDGRTPPCMKGTR